MNVQVSAVIREIERQRNNALADLANSAGVIATANERIQVLENQISELASEIESLKAQRARKHKTK
jgi:chromosome segregation ATPase